MKVLVIGDLSVSVAAETSKPPRLDRQVIEEIELDWVHVSGYTLLNRGQEKELGPFIKAATSKGFASLDLEGVAYSARSLPLEGAYVFCNQDEYHSYFRTEKVAPLSHPFTTLLKAGPSGSYLIRRGGLRRVMALQKGDRGTNRAGDRLQPRVLFPRQRGVHAEEGRVWGDARPPPQGSSPGAAPTISN